MAYAAGWYASTLCILFALTPAPVGQPRQILAGHLWNMLVGLACRPIPGALPWKQALAVALGISGQAFIGVIHPPATSLSLAFASDPQWTFTTLTAVCAADVVVVIISMVYLNLSETKQFPLYWLGSDVKAPVVRGARKIVAARRVASLEKKTDKDGPFEV